MKVYEVWVFGQNVSGLETNGGWQMFLRTFDKEEAERFVDLYACQFGKDNVMLSC